MEGRDGGDYEGKKKKGKSPPVYVIGMFTSLQQSDVAWIDTELRHDSEHVKEIKYVNASQIKPKDFDKAVSECTFCIYIVAEHRWKTLSPSDRKKNLSSFGKKKPIVLIIDMVDSSDEEKSRIMKDQPRIKDYILDLFLFRRMEEKSENPQNIGFSRESMNSFRDIGFSRESMNSFRGGSSENKLPEANLDQYRNLPYRLPQPDGTGGSSENKLNLNQYRNLPYRLPQPAGTGHSGMTQRPIDRKHIVGIFSRCAEEDLSWLVRLLNEAFQEFVGDVKYCFISKDGNQQLGDNMSHCTFGILYHSKKRGRANISDVEESLYDEELETLSAELGRKNIIVLIDDLRDGSDEEKSRILQTQPSISKRACDLILISVSEKENKLKMATKLKTLKFIFEGEYSNLKRQNTEKPEPRLEPQDPVNGAGNASPVQSRERIPNAVTTSSKSTVAIFSKSEESDYSWLSQQLSSGGLDVRSYKITSLNKDHPQETAFQCKLVILYHNMHDGKLRLTDAKDAMYHEELEMLSTKFGKRRMIVVIDDLVESNDKIKSEILERQPSTGRFARDLFLFSTKEKKYLKKKDPTKDGRKTMDKINMIKEMLIK
ncbi:uncharacterized protein ACMZJ9_010811 [Mantella aurantiaca]